MINIHTLFQTRKLAILFVASMFFIKTSLSDKKETSTPTITAPRKTTLHNKTLKKDQKKRIVKKKSPQTKEKKSPTLKKTTKKQVPSPKTPLIKKPNKKIPKKSDNHPKKPQKAVKNNENIAKKPQNQPTQKPKKSTNQQVANTKKTSFQNKKPHKKKDKAPQKTPTKKITKDPSPPVVNLSEEKMMRHIISYIQTEDLRSQPGLYMLAHKKLFRLYDKVLGLTSSLDKHPPLLDQNSAKEVSLYRGVASNPSYNLVNKLSKKLELSLLGKYNLLLFSSRLCNDVKKRTQFRKVVEATLHNADTLFATKLLYQELANVDQQIYQFFLREDIPFRVTQLIPSLIDWRSDVVSLVLIPLLGEKALDTNPMSVAWYKFSKTTLAALETVAGLETNASALARVSNTIWSICYHLTLGYLLSPRTSGKHIFEMPNQEQRLPYKIINFFYKRLSALFGLATGRGAILDIITGGGDENNLFYQATSPNGFHKDRLGLFSNLTSWFSWPYYCIIYTLKSLLQIIINIQELYSTLKRWQMVITLATDFLKKIASAYDLIVRLDLIVENDAALKKSLEEIGFLAPIKVLLADLRIRKIIQSIKKMSSQQPGLLEILNPFNSICVVAFNLYKELENLPPEIINKLYEGFACFTAYELPRAFAEQIYLSQKDMKKEKMCLVDTKPHQKLGFKFEGMYSPLIQGKKILNNIHLGGSSTTGDNPRFVFVYGQNGSGKSTFKQSIADSSICSILFGVALAEKATIYGKMPDKIYILSGNTSDMEKKTSSFMGIVDTLKTLLKLPETKQNIWVLADEFMGGKTYHLESLAIQYPVLKVLANAPNINTVYATHDLELLRLAKKEGFEKFSVCSTCYDKKTDKFTYKVEKTTYERPFKHPDSTQVLENKNYPLKHYKETIKLLRENKAYPDYLKEQLPFKEHKTTTPVWVLILLTLLLISISGGVFVGYKKWKIYSKKIK